MTKRQFNEKYSKWKRIFDIQNRISCHFSNEFSSIFRFIILKRYSEPKDLYLWEMPADVISTMIRNNRNESFLSNWSQNGNDILIFQKQTFIQSTIYSTSFYLQAKSFVLNNKWNDNSKIRSTFATKNIDFIKNDGTNCFGCLYCSTRKSYFWFCIALTSTRWWDFSLLKLFGTKKVVKYALLFPFNYKLKDHFLIYWNGSLHFSSK